MASLNHYSHTDKSFRYPIGTGTNNGSNYELGGRNSITNLIEFNFIGTILQLVVTTNYQYYGSNFLFTIDGTEHRFNANGNDNTGVIALNLDS